MKIDRYTKYHHTNANRRRSMNNILALKNEEGVWCNTRESLEHLLVTHYSSIHTSIIPEKDEGVLNCIPCSITDADNLALVRVSDATEIFCVLKSMKPWKAPGPGGFPPGFFQSHWDIIGVEVT